MCHCYNRWINPIPTLWLMFHLCNRKLRFQQIDDAIFKLQVGIVILTIIWSSTIDIATIRQQSLGGIRFLWWPRGPSAV